MNNIKGQKRLLRFKKITDQTSHHMEISIGHIYDKNKHESIATKVQNQTTSSHREQDFEISKLMSTQRDELTENNLSPPFETMTD